MIYYFSGTGNSRYVANFLSKELLERVEFIPKVIAEEESPDGMSVGLVFPVYSWGVPPLVMDFINRLPDSFWNEVKVGQLPIWCVMTCGDEVAMSPEMLQDAFRRRDVEVRSIWSVIMPNNYVLLPGFDVDSKDLADKKLADAPLRLKEICRGIMQQRETIDVVRGSMAWLKSKTVYPLFKRWGIFPGKWHSMETCVSCGICAKSCPLGNVQMSDGRPKWGDNCCSCLACYHSCPRHAVAYGKITQSKGQYFLPSKSKN